MGEMPVNKQGQKVPAPPWGKLLSGTAEWLRTTEQLCAVPKAVSPGQSPARSFSHCNRAPPSPIALVRVQAVPPEAHVSIKCLYPRSGPIEIRWSF